MFLFGNTEKLLLQKSKDPQSLGLRVSAIPTSPRSLKSRILTPDSDSGRARRVEHRFRLSGSFAEKALHRV